MERPRKSIDARDQLTTHSGPPRRVHLITSGERSGVVVFHIPRPSLGGSGCFYLYFRALTDLVKPIRLEDFDFGSVRRRSILLN